MDKYQKLFLRGAICFIVILPLETYAVRLIPYNLLGYTPIFYMMSLGGMLMPLLVFIAWNWKDVYPKLKEGYIMLFGDVSFKQALTDIFLD